MRAAPSHAARSVAGLSVVPVHKKRQRGRSGLKAWFGGAAAVAGLGLLVMLTQGPEESAAKPVATQAPVASAAPKPRAHPPRAVDYALVDARLRRLIADPRMVGLAIGIVEDGQITYLRGYGETSRGSGDPVTADTVFRWASVSKGVASTLVAGLAADGKLALDDPAKKHSYSLRLAGGGEERATIADILSHRLGIHSNAEDPDLEDGKDARLLRGELATLPPICPVGTCHAYQNVAYDASSEIVEKVTGKPYADVAAERLFKPLRMASASVGIAGLTSAPSWARPHDGSGRPQPRGLAPAYYNVPAAGGVNSSIRDLARWMQAQMGEAPDTLPPAVLAALDDVVDVVGGGRDQADGERRGLLGQRGGHLGGPDDRRRVEHRDDARQPGLGLVVRPDVGDEVVQPEGERGAVRTRPAG